MAQQAQEYSAIGVTKRADFDPNTLQWFAVRLTNGEVIAELPDLQCAKLSIRMEEISTAEATLPWDNRPKNWLEATKPYAVALLLVHYPVVQWGGIIVKRERSLGGKGLTLSLATFEHYLDSVYIGSKNFRATSQTEIVNQLVTSNLANHRILFGTDITRSTITRDREYTSDQDKTVLSALQELSNVIGGPEWYTEWRFDATSGAYAPVVVCADHIGSAEPITSFDDTVMSDFTVTEDYSGGYGANRVKATSTAEGGSRPESDWQTSSDTSRPLIERKYSPSTSITNKSTLNSHARQELLAIQDGTTTIAFSAALLTAPRIGTEWNLGDMVGWDLFDAATYFPDFLSGQARIIGYDLDFSGAWKLTPIIQAEREAD